MILNGKKIALEILSEIQKEVKNINGRKPALSVILIGENQSSITYVNAKKKACTKAGITSNILHLPDTLSQNDLLKTLEMLNQDPNIDGILVQLPLPSHIDENLVTAMIDPRKDVDGFHPINMGKLLIGEGGGFEPCTPLGIKVLLEREEVQVSGKHVVILGRSNIVGKPLATMLMRKEKGCDATVTVAHSQTKNLSLITQSADILIAAMGKSKFVTTEMVKPNAVVLDVGINRVKGKLIGDVDFERVKKIASKITPVPGGIGPMTIAMLLKNTLRAFSHFLIFLIFLSSCQKRKEKDPCTYFNGIHENEHYLIAVGKILSKKEQEILEIRIQEALISYDNHFNMKKPTSELSILNQSHKNTLTPLSSSMQYILELCEKIVFISNQRFDPTIEPIAKVWRESDTPDLQDAIEATGWNHISIHNGIFKKELDETQLNLGAITKGFLVDEISNKIKEFGIQDFLVQWGGGVRAEGHHPNAQDWIVQVNPGFTINNKQIAPIPLRNTAIATSGTNFFHIIDPTTAYPIQKTNFSIASTTVMAPTCAFADGLATAAMLFPNRREAEKWAEEVVDAYSDISFWIISYRNEL